MEFDLEACSEEGLERRLSRPSNHLVEMMKRLKGDIMILGISGKIGVSLGMQAMSAIRESGVSRKVYGVARFSKTADREKLTAAGVRTIVCDLMEREQVERLPKVENVIFMAGRKFGTDGSEDVTWAQNVVVPGLVAEHFRDSRIVAFSTGCVYPLRTIEQGGCSEDCMPSPIGEYSQSCLGRERIFEYYSRKYGTKLLLFRLNYSVDLRYGVLNDIGRAIWEGREVDNTVEYFNVIWQGDVTANALLSLELAANPRVILNVTGLETANVEETAREMGRIMGKDVRFKGNPGKWNYLSDASEMCRLFGKPSVSLEQLVVMQAEWIKNGGVSIGKPTHFEVNNGRF
ncbi:MAG: NAD(P)-dependent oxidoreductase [Victivallales bacterium]|nr:NAD(P)-dependent oxidoreductase [Victivallales bacterium]